MSKTFVSRTYVSKEVPKELHTMLREEACRNVEMQAASNGYYLITEVKHTLVCDVHFNVETGDAIDFFVLNSWAEAAPIINEWEKVLTNEQG